MHPLPFLLYFILFLFTLFNVYMQTQNILTLEHILKFPRTRISATTIASIAPWNFLRRPIIDDIPAKSALYRTGGEHRTLERNVFCMRVFCLVKYDHRSSMFRLNFSEYLGPNLNMIYFVWTALCIMWTPSACICCSCSLKSDRFCAICAIIIYRSPA